MGRVPASWEGELESWLEGGWVGSLCDVGALAGRAKSLPLCKHATCSRVSLRETFKSAANGVKAAVTGGDVTALAVGAGCCGAVWLGAEL